MLAGVVGSDAGSGVGGEGIRLVSLGPDDASTAAGVYVESQLNSESASDAMAERLRSSSGSACAGCGGADCHGADACAGTGNGSDPIG